MSPTLPRLPTIHQRFGQRGHPDTFPTIGLRAPDRQAAWHSVGVTQIEWPVDTGRLSLRLFASTDLDALWAFEQLPHVQRWLGWAPRSREELSTAMDPASSPTTHIMVVVASAVVGHIMIMPRDSWAQSRVASLAQGLEAELGWMFDPSCRGRGYATEAVRATIGVCFNSLHLRRVHAGCFADNTESWRLMDRLGMRREQHGRSTSLHSDGTWHDSYTYALLREEWNTDGGTRPTDQKSGASLVRTQDP